MTPAERIYWNGFQRCERTERFHFILGLEAAVECLREDVGDEEPALMNMEGTLEMFNNLDHDIRDNEDEELGRIVAKHVPQEENFIFTPKVEEN